MFLIRVFEGLRKGNVFFNFYLLLILKSILVVAPFNNHSKRLRCGPNAFLVIGNRHDPLNLEAEDEQLIQMHENVNIDRDQNISPTKLKNK